MNFLFIIWLVIVGCDYRDDIKDLKALKSRCADMQKGLEDLGQVKFVPYYLKQKIETCKNMGFIEEKK